MINYINGDLFATIDTIIAHGCNSMGVMGSGVAKTVKEKYPEAYEKYRIACVSPISNIGLGDNVTWKGKHRTIVNMITQKAYGRSGEKFVSYDAVDSCFQKLYLDMYQEWNVNGVWLKSVSIPKIGAGLGGGNWEVIKQIILYRTKDLPINLYVLD
jgi:O-acetyl-ADP-ribose deacetylase (regulator of RNase III)